MNNNPSSRLAIVLVTYNRLALLKQTLASIAEQTYPIDTVVIVDNASTDGTAEFLRAYDKLNTHVVYSEKNTGGAGGFYQGVKTAFELGFDWLYAIDDDVLPKPDCVATLMAFGYPAMISVREDKAGVLVERSALKYDLKNPFLANPKRLSIEQKYHSRDAMPAEVAVMNIPFEGLMVCREVIEQVGYPNPDYFISGDDVDYALRIRQAGYAIMAIRDAVLVRQLDYELSDALASWKAFYMYRNFFYIHYTYGENAGVRYKPYVLTPLLILRALCLGDLPQAKSIWQAIKVFKSLKL
ncbi:MAG: glycosyltransferase family 2 protein [Moraxella sp.]|nr:glycosyltransferase family 2 protein [Moraxella sp.]